ncbi:hypothetical protein KIN20_018019 [Parelaphostrongylus tenuis]|uniref:Uncharacterized protein n=1 Tax=Parelaphostrongylus tenuis TaxID=148309 RepID=A0AAD5N349_PARTN|nr:hypothetical protein KIN20_018019 [Parelaphostrongylus tenuis]
MLGPTTAVKGFCPFKISSDQTVNTLCLHPLDSTVGLLCRGERNNSKRTLPPSQTPSVTIKPQLDAPLTEPFLTTLKCDAANDAVARRPRKAPVTEWQIEMEDMRSTINNVNSSTFAPKSLKLSLTESCE